MTSTTTEYNRATYDRVWRDMSDYIRYNPGARHRRRHVFELLARCDFSSLLDVGCGNAELLRLIDARFPGKRLVGADLSSAVVTQNRDAHPAMEFFAVNVEGDALPKGFDVVTCTEVIEHLENPRAALRTLGDALAPNGHLILTCPTGKVWPTERYFGHSRHPSRTELDDWAKDAGLVVEEIWCWGFPFYGLTKWAQNISPQLTLKHFASQRPYGAMQIAVSTGLWIANYANLRSSPLGVQLFALFRKNP